MIIVKKEEVYGIDLYTFRNSHNIPYQLSFERNISGKHYDVSLVNLLGKSDGGFCKEIRTAISEITYEYLLSKRCTLFFDIEYSSAEKLVLLLKFLRWIELDERVDVEFLITNVEGIEYIEVYITLDEEYLKSIEVTD